MRKIILIGFTNRSARTTIRNNGADDLQERFATIVDDEQAHSIGLGHDIQSTRILDLGGSAVTADMLAVLEARFHKAASIQAAIRWLREEVAIIDGASKTSADAGAQLVSPAAKYRSPIRDRDGYEDFND